MKYTKEELGEFADENINKAYVLYANLYLYCADDNIYHFFHRDIDRYPIRDIVSEDAELYINAYKEAALDIYHHATEGSEETKFQLLEEFPELKEIIDEYDNNLER